MLTIVVFISFFFCYTVGTVSSHESTSWAVHVQCRRPGLHCSEDCSHLEMCIFDNGGSSLFIVESCDNQTCTSPPGECSSKPLGSACTFKFACQAEGVFPHPYDCTQYCSCNADRADPSCSFCNELGTAYNATSGKCDADVYQRICTENPVPLCEKNAGIYPLAEDPSIYYVCLPDDKGNLQPRFFKCNDGNEFDADTKRCSTTFKCTAPGFFPDPTNCTNYYYCNPENLPTLYSCNGTSYYNSTLKRCITGTCSSSVDPVRCTEDNVGIFPDDKDCTMYYVCTPDLIWSHVKCPVDTHFDRATNVCEVGPCDGSGTTSPTTSTPSFNCTSAGLYPDPDDCTKYYFCMEDGTPIHQTCTSGYFDPVELKCLSGTCPSGTEPTTTPIPPSTPSFDCPSAGLYPDPDDCTKYYFCMEDGTPIHQTCTSGYFDPVELKCVPGTCPPNFVCTDPGYFPNPQNCTTYFVCFNDMTFEERACRSGYHFDEFMRICVEGPCETSSTTSTLWCTILGFFKDIVDCSRN